MADHEIAQENGHAKPTQHAPQSSMLQKPWSMEHGAWLLGLHFIHERLFCMTIVIDIGKVCSEQREQNKESRVLVVVGVPPTIRPGSRFLCQRSS
jgi:hypothetical protein